MTNKLSRTPTVPMTMQMILSARSRMWVRYSFLTSSSDEDVVKSFQTLLDNEELFIVAKEYLCDQPPPLLAIRQRQVSVCAAQTLLTRMVFHSGRWWLTWRDVLAGCTIVNTSTHRIELRRSMSFIFRVLCHVSHRVMKMLNELDNYYSVTVENLLLVTVSFLRARDRTIFHIFHDILFYFAIKSLLNYFIRSLCLN